jgi:hypothetical protein
MPQDDAGGMFTSAWVVRFGHVSWVGYGPGSLLIECKIAVVVILAVYYALDPALFRLALRRLTNDRSTGP